MVWPTLFDTKLEEFDAMELPGQQLPSSLAVTTLDHLLNLDLNSPSGCQRLTGIIATMGSSTMDVDILHQMMAAGMKVALLNLNFGSSTMDVDILHQMMAAGMNVALLNLNFGTREDHVEIIKMLKQAAKDFSMTMGRSYPLAIAAKLAGRKIRTGMIPNDEVELKTGETVRLTTDETYKERCSSNTVYVDFMYFADQMKKNYIVLLDNETIMLKVEVISSSTLTCKIERGGILGSYKDVFVPNVVFDMPNYTEKDRSDVEMAMRNQVDILIAPFCNSTGAIYELRDILGDKGRKIAIVANIQTYEGYRNFDEIIKVANGVLVTRQELGSDISPNKLVIAQKNMIVRANKENVPICISAHLLDSMKENHSPLRAELLDIANCILDGADALVLSGETAIGLNPVETVSCLASACKEAESCIWTKQIFHDLIDKTPIPCDQATGAAIAAVLAVQRSLAAAIIVVTTTGKSAQIVAKYRPRCPVIAVTRYAQIARQLHLYRGIMPVIYEDSPDVDWQNDLEKRVNYCTKWAMERGFVRIGDPIAIVSGWRQGSGFTNTMRLVYTAADTTVA